MDKITLIATTTFGLEAVVKNELKKLGFYITTVADGRIEFDAHLGDIAKANLWLRCADRVLLKIGEFKAVDFDQLFDQTRALPWEQWIVKGGKITVTGKSVKSTLASVRSNQSIVKKAIVERLKEKYKTEWLDESGMEFTVQVALLKDVAQLTLDTSGEGLHKRGYRSKAGEAPLKETLAAAMVLLSEWKPDGILIDPMCGSGTIPIEAAMIARNIAPGLKREFASENWPIVPSLAWQEARQSARKEILPSGNLKISGYDIDPAMIKIALANARKCGVNHDIIFEQKNIKDLWIDKQYGTIICNPPYGVKLLSAKALSPVYILIHNMFRKKKGWGVYVLTADKRFPNYFKRSAPEKVRKLFNGAIEVNYYQYSGEKGQ